MIEHTIIRCVQREGTHYGNALNEQYIAVLQSVPAWQAARWIPAPVEVADDRVETELGEYAERVQKLRAGR